MNTKKSGLILDSSSIMQYECYLKDTILKCSSRSKAPCITLVLVLFDCYTTDSRNTSLDLAKARPKWMRDSLLLNVDSAYSVEFN